MLVRCKKEVFDVEVCRSVFSKLRGLMFRKRLKKDGLLFVFKKEAKVSLHMLFVLFPIDVVYLNRGKKVVGIKRNVKPFSLYVLGPPAQYILELKDAKAVKVGERFSITLK